MVSTLWETMIAKYSDWYFGSDSFGRSEIATDLKITQRGN